MSPTLKDMWHVPLPLKLWYHAEPVRLAAVRRIDAGQWRNLRRFKLIAPRDAAEAAVPGGQAGRGAGRGTAEPPRWSGKRSRMPHY